MPLISMTAGKDDSSALPPLPNDHGFREGDRVEVPVYGRQWISGTVKHIDKLIAARRYKGLAVLGDDGFYYELIPEARKLKKETPIPGT